MSLCRNESRNHTHLFGTCSLGVCEPWWDSGQTHRPQPGQACPGRESQGCPLFPMNRSPRGSLWPHARWGWFSASRAVRPYSSRASKGIFENAGFCSVLLSHFPGVGAGARIPGCLWPAARAWPNSLPPPAPVSSQEGERLCIPGSGALEPPAPGPSMGTGHGRQGQGDSRGTPPQPRGLASRMSRRDTLPDPSAPQTQHP